jgi:hypothetical protein
MYRRVLKLELTREDIEKRLPLHQLINTIKDNAPCDEGLAFVESCQSMAEALKCDRLDWWAWLATLTPEFDAVMPWTSFETAYWYDILCERPELAEKCHCLNQLSAMDKFTLLHISPEIAEFMDDDINLTPNMWSLLLQKQPQLVTRCPDFGVGVPTKWKRLLELQPQLAKYMPKPGPE